MSLPSSVPLTLQGDTTQLPLSKTRQHHRQKGFPPPETPQGGTGKGSPGAMGMKLSEGEEGPEGGVSGLSIWGCRVTPLKVRAARGCGSAQLQWSL